MLQDILTNMGYISEKFIWKKAVINIYFIYQNEYTKHNSQLN